eukprot:CAMPEP_0194302156 /NCGR_PEP_ID=MMETSP0169-20130528/62189_1 /TAXON_ID=218684 /ORGANISM="Corethron pennatum, Strain L29A3" /LENGTH=245 /DNA_ID=CAMNT_0039052471 /DNA_START=50 /DNA_END=784 /DNA_ORIENTATION=+
MNGGPVSTEQVHLAKKDPKRNRGRRKGGSGSRRKKKLRGAGGDGGWPRPSVVPVRPPPPPPDGSGDGAADGDDGTLSCLASDHRDLLLHVLVGGGGGPPPKTPAWASLVHPSGATGVAVMEIVFDAPDAGGDAAVPSPALEDLCRQPSSRGGGRDVGDGSRWSAVRARTKLFGGTGRVRSASDVMMYAAPMAPAASAETAGASGGSGGAPCEKIARRLWELRLDPAGLRENGYPHRPDGEVASGS